MEFSATILRIPKDSPLCYIRSLGRRRFPEDGEHKEKRARLISRSGKYIFKYFERHGLSSSGYV